MALLNPQHFNLMKADLKISMGGVFFALLAVTCLFATPARAGFHLWEISEVFSSADGSVQFVEMRAQTGGQQFFQSFGGASSVLRSTNSLGTSTFTFATNLPGDTTSRTCIIGTSNLASIPGGVTPNYIIPAGFVRRATGGGGAAVVFGPNPSFGMVVTNLPSDGVSALIRSASGALLVPTNSPRNFQNQSNSIVPTGFASAAQSGGDLVLNFRTATGVNGSTGPNYAIEGSGTVSPPAWSVATNVTGNGNTQTVAIPINFNTNQVFRLRVP